MVHVCGLLNGGLDIVLAKPCVHLSEIPLLAYNIRMCSLQTLHTNVIKRLLLRSCASIFTIQYMNAFHLLALFFAESSS